MEGYAVDYIRVHGFVHVVQCEYMCAQQLFNALKECNIETCICSKRLDMVTAIMLKSQDRSYKESGAEIYRLLNERDIAFSVLCDLSLLDIGGNFIAGSAGVSNAALDALGRARINIEYQLMNPSRYSILIGRKYRKKALKILTEAMSIRDNMVSIQS